MNLNLNIERFSVRVGFNPIPPPRETRSRVQLQHGILCPQHRGRVLHRPPTYMGGPLQEDVRVDSGVMLKELVGGRIDPQRGHRLMQIKHVGVQRSKAVTAPRSWRQGRDNTIAAPDQSDHGVPYPHYFLL